MTDTAQNDRQRKHEAEVILRFIASFAGKGQPPVADFIGLADSWAEGKSFEYLRKTHLLRQYPELWGLMKRQDAVYIRAKDDRRESPAHSDIGDPRRK